MSFKRQYSSYIIPTSVAGSRPDILRISCFLRYTILIAFFGMISLSCYIFLNFLPTIENGQLIMVPNRRPKVRDDQDLEVIFPPRRDAGSLFHSSSNIRETYKTLYEIQSKFVGADLVKDANKYLIYRCDAGKMSGCGDWSDHIRGIEAAYLIANLTGRVFKAEICGYSCQILDYMKPNLVNWSLVTTFHEVLNKGMAGISIRNFDNNFSFYNSLYMLDLSQFVEENFEFVYFKSNLDLVSGFQNSTVYLKQLSWMRGLALDEVHAILYKRLFQLSPKLMKRLELFLYSILPSPDHRLICADLGNSKKGSGVSDDGAVTFNTNEHGGNRVENIWSFIRSHSLTNIDKVFIRTDASELLARIKSESFRSRVVFSPRARTPMGRLERGDAVCESLEADIFNLHVLITCDVLVVSTSGLGQMAAYLRGSDHGLFCLLKNGHIHPCRADKLEKLFSVHD